MKKDRTRFVRTALVALAALGLAGAVSAAPPPNDTCTSAQVITGADLPYVNTFDTTAATSGPNDPAVSCISPAPEKTVWFAFTPALDDTYSFDTAGTAPPDYV